MKKVKNESGVVVQGIAAVPKEHHWLSPKDITNQDVYFEHIIMGIVIRCWKDDNENFRIIARLFDYTREGREVLNVIQAGTKVSIGINYDMCIDKNKNIQNHIITEVCIVVGEINPDYNEGSIDVVA